MLTMRGALVLLLVVLLTIGVAPAARADDPTVVPAAGNYPKQTSTGRDYVLHVPEGYDGHEPLPLVLVLHGFGEVGPGLTKLGAMSDKSDDEGFFVAYLIGSRCVPGEDPSCDGSQRAWNSGLTPQLGITADDVGFARDVIAGLATELKLDSHRVYAAGFSNGGMMTHRLAAELPDVLAGVGVVEGAFSLFDGAHWLTIPQATGPIAVAIVHGKAEEKILYDGGEGEPPGHLWARPVVDALAYWAATNRCDGDPEVEALGAGNVATSYERCIANSDVVLYTIANGGHAWPTSEANGLSATDALWEFFSAHSATG